MMMIVVLVFNRNLLGCVVSPQVNARQSWILDFTLWNLDSSYWILDSLGETWIPDSSHLWDSGFFELDS